MAIRLLNALRVTPRRVRLMISLVKCCPTISFALISLEVFSPCNPGGADPASMRHKVARRREHLQEFHGMASNRLIHPPADPVSILLIRVFLFCQVFDLAASWH
jgi:hypothetical protein